MHANFVSSGHFIPQQTQSNSWQSDTKFTKMIFKRDFSFNANKNSQIIVIGFFICLFVSSVMLSPIVISGMDAPVYEKIFGKYFVIGHLGPISAIVVFTIIAITAYKKGYTSLHSNYLRKAEISQFKSDYNTVFLSAKRQRRWYVTLLLVLLSTTFPIIFTLISYQIGVNTSVGLWTGLIAMFWLFYSQILKSMRKGNATTNDIFNFINTTFNNTNIKLLTNSLNYSFVSLTTDLHISGIYKDHKFDYRYLLSGHKYSDAPSYTNNTLFLKFALNYQSTEELKIDEKNYLWKNSKGKTIDDCFSKRFKIEGSKTEALTEELKKDLLNYQRNVSIKIRDKYLIYELIDLQVLPFYTMEGFVYFLDFILKISKDFRSCN